MSTQLLPQPRDFGGSIGRVLRAPVRRQTYRNLCYLLLTFPLGVFYFTVLTVGISAGVPLVMVVVGIPILLLVLVAVVELAGLERSLVRGLLRVDVPTPPAETEHGIWVRSKRLVTDTRTWKATAYLLSVFAFGTVMITLIASLLATSAGFLLAPLYYRHAPVTVRAFGPIPSRHFTLDLLFGWDNLLVGLTTTVRIGSWHVETLPGALLVACFGAVLLTCSLQLFNGLAWVWGRYAGTMLSVPRYWSTPW